MMGASEWEIVGDGRSQRVMGRLSQNVVVVSQSSLPPASAQRVWVRANHARPVTKMACTRTRTRGHMVAAGGLHI
jgi:hypothetical protein